MHSSSPWVGSYALYNTLKWRVDDLHWVLSEKLTSKLFGLAATFFFGPLLLVSYYSNEVARSGMTGSERFTVLVFAFLCSAAAVHIVSRKLRRLVLDLEEGEISLVDAGDPVKVLRLEQVEVTLVPREHLALSFFVIAQTRENEFVGLFSTTNKEFAEEFQRVCAQYKSAKTLSATAANTNF